jgi:hypothetical protein
MATRSTSHDYLCRTTGKERAMSQTSELDTVSFPGGYDLTEQIVAVKLAAMKHVRPVPVGELDLAIAEAWLRELWARNPTIETLQEAYQVHAAELAEERLSLLNSHLRMSWFALAYWSYGLIAVRSGVSTADHDGEGMFIEPVSMTLRELGVRVSKAECIEEVDRFLPFHASPRSVEASTHAFLSFVRFLHRAALRRRRVVTPGLSLPDVAIAHAARDSDEADRLSRFLTSHGVTVQRQPEALARTSRLLVLLSPDAIGATGFWEELDRWRQCPVVPMVLCLMPKAELYRDPPRDVPPALWAWLGENVAVTLSPETDRYGVLLHALDTSDPRQWWWNEGDTMELGLAVDVLGEGIPRRATRLADVTAAPEPYPYSFDRTWLEACVLASERAALRDADGADREYIDACNTLLRRRQRPCGEPYALPWFVVLYRAWLSIAGESSGSVVYGDGANLELQVALFALGIGTQPAEGRVFLEGFTRLPWGAQTSSIAVIDERTVAFVTLIHRLSQAALARGQRMRLQHPPHACFVSYARPDEAVARDLVARLEAKGADVWWDLHAITLGAPLDDSLRSAVADATVLFLVATPTTDRSAYVRVEVETAIRNGLRIVAIAPDGRLPPALQTLQASAHGAFDKPIVLGADTAPAFDAALARLQRTPEEQLRWLQSQAMYRDLHRDLAAAREEAARGD